MILFLLLVLLLLSYLYLQQRVEGFELGPYYNDAVFDSFYSYHFDEIFNTIALYEEMILKVMPLLTQGTSMLWIGSRN